jgi:hypothetical protein
MWRRRRPVPPAPSEAFDGFRRTAERVEEAKATLLLGVPSGRAPRLPFAEALAGFESALGEAADLMPAWRIPEVSEPWEACFGALAEAGRRASRLRLEDSPTGYEELAPALEELLDPLDAFDAAARWFRRRGA